jgi:hypothetical protein
MGRSGFVHGRENAGMAAIGQLPGEADDVFTVRFA